MIFRLEFAAILLARKVHEFGFVYQAVNLVPMLTVADNLRLLLELNNVPNGEAADRIDGLLHAVELARTLHEGGRLYDYS